jgi:hypothetical protein
MPLIRKQLGPFLCRTAGRWSQVAVGGGGVPTIAANKGTKRGIRSNKRGPKWQPQQVVVTTICDEGNNDKNAGDSDEEVITTAERDFKCKSWQPADHFKKHLEATCPNHTYPIWHKLKECTMMKNYMTMGTFAGSSRVTRRGRQSPLSSKRRWSCQFMADQPPMSHVASSNSPTKQSML